VLSCTDRRCEVTSRKLACQHADVGHAGVEAKRSRWLEGFIWKEREKVDFRAAAELAHLQIEGRTCKGMDWAVQEKINSVYGCPA